MNPYDPSLDSPIAGAGNGWMNQNHLALLAFVPGAITGILVSMAISFGPELAARRVLAGGLIRPVVVACAFFLFALAYCSIRRLMFGGRLISWYSGFLIGFLHVSLATAAIATLHLLKLVDVRPPPTLEDWGIHLFVIGACSVPAVELGAVMSFSRNGNSVGG